MARPEHPLSDLVKDLGEPSFVPKPWYDPHGDCLEYCMVNEEVVGDRIDGILTIYRSIKDDRPVGCEIIFPS